MSTALTVANDAIDLVTATCEQLDMLASTLRAIRRAYPDVFVNLSEDARSGLKDVRCLSDLGLNAVADWRDYLASQAAELVCALEAQEVDHA